MLLCPLSSHAKLYIWFCSTLNGWKMQELKDLAFHVPTLISPMAKLVISDQIWSNGQHTEMHIAGVNFVLFPHGRVPYQSWSFRGEIISSNSNSSALANLSKKVTVNIIIMITLSKFKRDHFNNKRERENKHQKCTVLGVSCENTECTKSCLVHVQKQQWLRHIFSSFRFRMTKRRLRKN